MFIKQRVIRILACLLISFPALLHGQTTFHQSAPVNFPGLDEAPEAANPFPSTITVAGVSGLISGIRVRFHGFQHDFPDAVDIMLESPNGINLVLMSDVGAAVDVNNIDITIDDAAAQFLPDNSMLTTGSFKPTNIGNEDIWPAQAPTPSANTTLAAFNGFGPNGTWKLYASGDVEGISGSISGGWSLTLFTSNNSALETMVTHFHGTYLPDKNAIQLQWIFEPGADASMIELLHSTNQTLWNNIADYSRADAINYPRPYSFHHYNPAYQKHYYRLKINLAQGGSRYSPVVAVTPPPDMGEWHVYPNPARSFVMIATAKKYENNTTLCLTNAQGKILETKNIAISRDRPIKWELHQKPGVYFLVFKSNGSRMVQQLIVTD